MEKRGTKKKRILSELYNICVDAEAKASDRISAAKLYLDNEERDSANEDSVLKVIFENTDEEFLK